MGFRKKYSRIAGHILHAYGRYYGLLKSAHPVTLTFSVTGRCQSRCKTCEIGLYSQTGKFDKKADLTLDEIEKIFRSLGKIYFFNISGGEPFLRKDLPEIIDLAVKYLKPAIIHIPTNALLPQRIEEVCTEVLEKNRERKHIVPFTVKPSIDGVGKNHDIIRGVPGNFQKLEETIVRLKLIEDDYPEFHLELGTVVSKFNLDHLSEIEDFVHSLDVQSYRNEIAEERAEFHNKGKGITPSAELYESVMKRFAEEIKQHLPEKKSLTRLTESLRLVYYDLVVKILKAQTQIIPCYGGITNLHLNFDGQLWPCCVLAYDKPLADLRESNYDVQTAISTQQAKNALQFIRNKHCYCPLANQWYSNILMHPPTLLRVILNYFLVDSRGKQS